MAQKLDHILHTYKSTSNKHVKQYWCETSENIFEKMTKDLHFDLFGGPKWPQHWASDAHIPHTAESTWNEHLKLYWCETSENVLKKWPNSRILTYFGVRNGPKKWAFGAHIVHISESSSNEHIKQDNK